MRGKHKKRPLIAHVIFKLGVGGLENGLVNLINSIPKEKYIHAIICMTDYTDFKDRIQQHDVEIYCLHKKKGKDFWVFFKLWKLFIKLKPDILHTRNLSSLEAQLPGFFAGIKVRIHGEHGWDLNDLDGSHRRYTFLRRLYRLFIQRYIPMSKVLENWLINQIYISPLKISQIYNGVDVTKFQTEIIGKQEHILPQAFTLKDYIFIGTVGRQEIIKDPITLLNAFIELISESPELTTKVRLIMVGDGTLNSKLKYIAKSNNIENLVWFAGERANIAELLQTFDIFVLPSISEGISNTILEAMSTGLPVIATHVGGNSELVVNDYTGFLVKSRSNNEIMRKLKFYLDNPNIMLDHGANGRKVCEQKFSLKKMVNGYIDMYDQAYY